MIKVFLKPNKDEAVRRFHPWVFSGAIGRMEGKPIDGDIVAVYDSHKNYLATGHYQQGGSISIRLFSFEDRIINRDFWLKKLQNAYFYRQCLHLPNKNTNCYRLVHAEGDGLSGLIIDVYDKTAVIQCYSIGMHRQIDDFVECLQIVLGKNLTAIYNKSRETLPEKYAMTVKNDYLFGKNAVPALVKEYDNTFYIDWETGQKTGFFLDQRENRHLLSQYVAGKNVLNAFSYSGGFSIYALKAGAKMVHSVDISLKAVDLIEKNINANGFSEAKHQSFTAEVLPFLKENTEKYDVMVVDPPAFAKSIEKRHNAVQGYKRLNEAALRQINAGGILFTFSCSQVVDRMLFYHTIVAAAIEARREVRVLHHLEQPADHPSSLFHPESAYLKGLVLYVS